MLFRYEEPSIAEKWFEKYVKDKIVPKILEEYAKDYSERTSDRMYNSGYITSSYNYSSCEYDLHYEINLSSEFTKLIQDTGRFAERFASDILIDIDAIKRNLDNGKIEEPFMQICGIRASGVDGTGFYVANLQQNKNSDYYRRVYAFFIFPENYGTDKEDNSRIFTCLMDITADYYSQAHDLQKFLKEKK